jgi:hypothetical protein
MRRSALISFVNGNVEALTMVAGRDRLYIRKEGGFRKEISFDVGGDITTEA